MVEQLRLDQVETPEFLDTIYAILADADRRSALQYLVAHGEPVSVHELATELAELNSDLPRGCVTPDQREEMYLRLKHAHLPMLSDTGLVEWDWAEDRLALSPLLEHLSVTVRTPSSILDVSLSARPETDQ